MATTSKYVTDEDILEARKQLTALDEEYTELSLLARTGADITEAKKQLDEAKNLLVAFINTYHVPDKIQRNIKGK